MTKRLAKKILHSVRLAGRRQGRDYIRFLRASDRWMRYLRRGYGPPANRSMYLNIEVPPAPFQVGLSEAPWLP